MDIPPSRDEIARLATTLNDLLARLEAVIARERSFVSDASHELRSPLARLKVEIDLALRYPRSHTQLQDALRSASEETDHLVRLAEDLLLLTRADATRHQPSQTRPSVALAPLLTRLADRHQAATGRLMRLDCPLGLAVRADPVRLERAVANLIDNAVQHGRGPIGITATPATTTAGEQIEIHVTTTDPDSRPPSCPMPSNASPGLTRPAPVAAPASDWPSSPPSPAASAATPTQATPPAGAHTYGSPCPHHCRWPRPTTNRPDSRGFDLQRGRNTRGVCGPGAGPRHRSTHSPGAVFAPIAASCNHGYIESLG